MPKAYPMKMSNRNTMLLPLVLFVRRLFITLIGQEIPKQMIMAASKMLLITHP